MVRGVGFGWARTLRRDRRAKITPGGENADDFVLGSLAPSFPFQKRRENRATIELFGMP